MDANSTHITSAQIDSAIYIDTEVKAYKNLHIRQPSSQDNFISFHLLLKDNTLSLKHIEHITSKIKDNLAHLGFNHILIQVDKDSSYTKENHVSM
jgi:Co/Zn/Cd efflux system component